MFKQNTKALQKNEKSDLDSITIPLFKRSAFLIIAICFLLGVAVGIVGVVLGSLSLEKVTDRNQFGTISGVVTNFDNPYLTIDNENKYEISDFLNNNADWNSIKINDYANLTYCTDIDGIQYIIGLEINGNQLLSVDDGIERFKDATTIIIIVFAVLLALFTIATIVMFILYFKNKDKKTKKSIISN